jgi:FixJ family two-component response regulator
MNRKIGLIEDDATMLSLLQTLFNLEGYRPVLFAPTTLTEVLANVVEEQPAALLIDVHLKTFNGIDLTRSLRSTPNIEQPVIVMASGMDLTKECKKAGADHFFLKPYMPQDLITWLKLSLNP